jgi:hypothetical protein
MLELLIRLVGGNDGYPSQEARTGSIDMNGDRSEFPETEENATWEMKETSGKLLYVTDQNTRDDVQ